MDDAIVLENLDGVDGVPAVDGDGETALADVGQLLSHHAAVEGEVEAVQPRRLAKDCNARRQQGDENRD